MKHMCEGERTSRTVDDFVSKRCAPFGGILSELPGNPGLRIVICSNTNVNKYHILRVIKHEIVRIMNQIVYFNAIFLKQITNINVSSPACQAGFFLEIVPEIEMDLPCPVISSSSVPDLRGSLAIMIESSKIISMTIFCARASSF